MFFFERDIYKQVHNSGGLYFRFIDDLFIIINWPQRHFLKQIEKWNQIDLNIKLTAHVGLSTDFLDLHIEKNNGTLFTKYFTNHPMNRISYHSQAFI